MTSHDWLGRFGGHLCAAVLASVALWAAVNQDAAAQSRVGESQHRAADVSKSAPPGNGPQFAGEDGVRKGREQAFLTRVDTTFLNDATKAGMAEQRASELAVQRAGNPQLRAFAQQLVSEHQQRQAELRRLADRKGVELPDGLSMAQAARLQRMQAAQGAEFDRLYQDLVGVDTYRDAIERYEAAASDAGDSDVRDFARKALPALQRHLASARRFAASP